MYKKLFSGCSNSQEKRLVKEKLSRAEQLPLYSPTELRYQPPAPFVESACALTAVEVKTPNLKLSLAHER